MPLDQNEGAAVGAAAPDTSNSSAHDYFTPGDSAAQVFITGAIRNASIAGTFLDEPCVALRYLGIAEHALQLTRWALEYAAAEEA